MKIEMISLWGGQRELQSSSSANLEVVPRPPSTTAVAADIPMIVHSRPLRSEVPIVDATTPSGRALTDFSHLPAGAGAGAGAGEDGLREMFILKAAAALQFVRLVKGSVSSTEEYEAFVRVLVDFQRRMLGFAGNQKDHGGYLLRVDTFRLVEELLQSYPLLIVRFRELLAQLSEEFTLSGLHSAHVEDEDEDLVEPFSRKPF